MWRTRLITTPANTDTIVVVIRVLQANDAPMISGAATIEHVEGGTALDTDLGTADIQLAMYDATDADPTNTTLTFSLSGDGHGPVQAQGHHCRREYRDPHSRRHHQEGPGVQGQA